jgi:hypothetical protein
MNNWNGKVRCIKESGTGFFKEGEVYNVKNSKIEGCLTIVNNIEELNKYIYSQFEEVFDKVKILLKDNFEIEFNNKKYLIHKWTNYAKLRITQNGNIEHEIRWGESFNTTLADIQPILDTLNIEIVEEQPKYKIDIEGEYTEEELEVIKKVGIKFKKVGD